MPDDYLAGGPFPTRERAVSFMHALVRAFDDAGLADEWAIFMVGNLVWLHHRTDEEMLRQLWLEYTVKPSLRSRRGTDSHSA